MDNKGPIPLKFSQSIDAPLLKKPSWIRVKLPNHSQVPKIKSLLRQNKLHTVCEEASCPNLPECFSGGTATFMIMGNICTRKCRFCDVGHGRPASLDSREPIHLAEAIKKMQLNYVVITSVDRDDLKDGGANHFIECIRTVRSENPGIKIEILVPDFRRCMQEALEILSIEPPDVFNHNLETVPRLYKRCRPGARYEGSLELFYKFKKLLPNIPTKSGIMFGLGDEIGFSNVASGPFVRSSYHADLQAKTLS